MATERLTEYVNNRGVAIANIDREKGVIPGVKILGLESKNGRKYLPEGVRAAKALYEGSAVNVNHPTKANANEPRLLQDRFGNFQNVVYREGQGLFGDLHFNPKHAMAEQITWDAEHAPHRFGASHNVSGKTRREAGGLVVEGIETVHSVDLVADPATTRGLFENQESTMKVSEILEAAKDKTSTFYVWLKEATEAGTVDAAMPVEASPDQSSDEAIKAAFRTAFMKIVSDAFDDDALNAAGTLAAIKANGIDLLKALDKRNGKKEGEPSGESKPEEATEAMHIQKINQLTEQVATLTAQNNAAARERLVESKLAILPPHLHSPELRQLLTEAKDEAHIDRLIKTIGSVAKDNRPRSTGPYPVQESSLLESVKDAKSFVHALTH